MRQTACDICGKTDPAMEPIGWVLIGIVTEAPAEASSILAAMGMQSKTRAHELRTFTVCSTKCLATFAELEGVKPEQ